MQVRDEYSDWRSRSCIPHRNHAMLATICCDDEFLVSRYASRSDGIGVALKKALLTELIIEYDCSVGGTVEEALAVRSGQINDSTKQIFAEAKNPRKRQGAFVCAHSTVATQSLLG